MNNRLLEGPPGSGKTTLILKIAELLSNYQVGGFFTREIREHGQRTGFRIETFSGHSGILAHIKITAGPMVGKYRVDVKQFEHIAIGELETALATSAVILIDEIGKMELFSARFKKFLPRCFDSKTTLIASVMSHSFPFVDHLKARSDVRLIKVSGENRQNLAVTLVSEIGDLNNI